MLEIILECLLMCMRCLSSCSLADALDGTSLSSLAAVSMDLLVAYIFKSMHGQRDYGNEIMCCLKLQLHARQVVNP